MLEIMYINYNKYIYTVSKPLYTMFVNGVKQCL